MTMPSTNEIQHSLEQFRQGRCKFEQLRDAVDRCAAEGPEARRVLGEVLAAEFEAGRLEPAVYFRLDACLAAAEDELVETGEALTIAPEVWLDTPTLGVTPASAGPRLYVPPATAKSGKSPSSEDRTLGPDATELRTVVEPAGPASRKKIPAPEDRTLVGEATELRTLIEPPAPPKGGKAPVPPAGDNTLVADATELRTVVEPAALDATQVAAGLQPVADATLVETVSGTQAPTIHLAREPVSDKPLEIGTVLKDRFVLEEIIGGGGMGMVFKALDLRKSEARDKDPYVALKVLNAEFRDNPISLIALQRETKRAQTLSHPNIINVFDFDRDGSHVFMSMEHLTGRPLSQLIRDLPETGLPFKEAWPIIRAMGDALGYAHKKDIIHSDFKPGNVFIDDQDEVKILDFGIACAAGRPDKKGDATLFNARELGALTPAYASLEMILNRDPDPKDDIYALGCVAYELLTGKHPYGKVAADKALDLKLQPKPVPGLSRRQWKALQRAIALKGEDRTPSVEEFLDSLGGTSKVMYGVWAVGLIALAGTGVNLYVTLNAPVEAPKVQVSLTPEQTEQVKNLLDVAAIHFEVGYLTAPTGNNALWAYQEALKIDPYNADAIKGLKRIADAMEQSAWESFERGDQPGSLKKVMDGLEAVPDHPGLLALRAKLER
jgi:serine/threonine protein kinase